MQVQSISYNRIKSLYIRATPIGVVKTVACRFYSMFGMESNDGITKTSRRRSSDDKYGSASLSDKYRQHLQKMYAKRLPKAGCKKESKILQTGYSVFRKDQCAVRRLNLCL